jgi:hypothetical protein
MMMGSGYGVAAEKRVSKFRARLNRIERGGIARKVGHLAWKRAVEAIAVAVHSTGA